MADYSVSEAFQQIEEHLIDSMIRNMSRHLSEEKKEGFRYTQWQAEQLAALAEFRTANKKNFKGYFSKMNESIELALRRAYQSGKMAQEAEILEALKKGWTGRRASIGGSMTAEFFRINEDKLNAYIKAVVKDMEKAETALLRMADDQYRKTIFNAGVAYNTGAYTLPQAIDAATKDYLSRGLACIEYKNGARVLIDTYAEMALRTSVTRSYLMGESAKRDEWGINTVIVARRGAACPKCLQYVGRVFYDDVYGNIPVPDDKYPRLSAAIAGGLYHPNCKDIHTTYFEGVSTLPKPLTFAQEKRAAEIYDLEQRQRYNERQIRKFRRLAENTLDPEQKQKYTARLKQWEQVNADFVEAHGDVLKRRYEREDIRELAVRVEKPPVSGKKALDKSVESGIIETDEQMSELGYFKKKTRSDKRMSDEYYQAVKDKFSHGSDNAKAVFNKYVPNNSVADAEYYGGAYYSPTSKKIYMSYADDLTNARGACATWFHEHGHLIDDMAGNVSNNAEFRRLLDDDYLTYMRVYGKEHKLKTFDKVQTAISNDLSTMREHSAVADLLNGLSKGNIKGVARHRADYWTDDSVYCSEAFAHMYEAQFDPIRYAEMKKYFPSALNKFEEMLGGLV